MLALLALLALFACDSTPADGSTGPETGDALSWLARSDTSTFWETTDAVALGDAVYTCTGVKSLVVHDASLPAQLHDVETLSFAGSDRIYPRCSHLALDRDRLLVGSRLDEIQPTPWLALVDLSDPLEPTTLDEWASDELLLEQVALDGDQAWVAALDHGVLPVSTAGDTLTPGTPVGGLGTVLRVATTADGLAVGTAEGQVHWLSRDLDLLGTVSVGAAVQAVQDLGDGRLAVALGSGGLALVDTVTAACTWRGDTLGTAVRLALLETGELLVANWTDVRLYDVSGAVPRVLAVDHVAAAGSEPRTLAAAAAGDRVYAGEWEGLHVFQLDRNLVGPELTPHDLHLDWAADGAEQTATLTLTNEGQQPLVLDGVDVPDDGWTVYPIEAELLAGASERLTVHYAGGEESQRGALILHTNDPDEPTTAIDLRVGGDGVFVGDPAPDLTATAVNTGETLTLSDQRGKVVILSYFATF